MLKGHPKGLLVAFFANMGERFGFYTMMAILVLFLQAKYGLTEKTAGGYYSWFYFGIYALALIGGIIADATRKYKVVILVGIIIMFFGYLLMAYPTKADTEFLWLSLTGLFVIALGNGMFKGNLQAVVGQLYDDPKYSSVRDSAFLIFYMGINVGAFFAPFAANGIRNWFLSTQGFTHDGSLPAMCHAFNKGTLEDTSAFQTLADKVSGVHVNDLSTFAQQYIDTFSKGYNWAFAIAAGTMIISLLVYVIFNKHLPSVSKIVPVKNGSENGISKKNATSSPSAILLAIGLMFATSFIFYFLLDDQYLGMAVGLFLVIPRSI